MEVAMAKPYGVRQPFVLFRSEGQVWGREGKREGRGKKKKPGVYEGRGAPLL